MRLFWFLFAFLALALVAFAAAKEDVYVVAKPVDSVIPAGGEAIFSVILTNNQTVNDVFEIKAKELSLYPFSDFAADLRTSERTIPVKRYSSEMVYVYVRTLSSAKEGKTYELPIEVVSTLDKKLRIAETLFLRILPANQLIEITAQFPEEVKPGKKTPFAVTFINKGNVVVANAEVYITSPVFSDTRILTFKPEVDVEETFVLEVDEYIEPGTYPFSIRVYQDNEIKGVYAAEIKVTAHEKLDEQKDVEESFLMKTVTLTYTNTGNSPIEKTVVYEVTGLERFFSRTEPKAQYNDGMYTWEFTVGRGKNYELQIVANYRTPLIIFLILLVAGWAFWYWWNRRLHVKKKMFHIRHDAEEGMSDMKVMIHLKNKTGKILHEVKIIDLVPSYVLLSKEYSTLKPDHIQQGSSGGLRLIWDIGTLAEKEERIVSYKIKTKTTPALQVTLPGCSAQYIGGKGDLIIERGNSVKFSL